MILPLLSEDKKEFQQRTILFSDALKSNFKNQR